MCKYIIIDIASVNDQHASAWGKRGGGDLSQSSASWNAEMQCKIISSNTVKAFIQKFLWNEISCHRKTNLNLKPISELVNLVRIFNRIMHILVYFSMPTCFVLNIKL